MRNCPACGNPLSDNDFMCRKCGMPVSNANQAGFSGPRTTQDLRRPQPEGVPYGNNAQYQQGNQSPIQIPAPKKQNNYLIWIICAAIVAVAIIVSVLIVVNGNSSSSAQKDEYAITGTDTQTDSKTASAIGDASATEKSAAPAKSEEAAATDGDITGYWMLTSGPSYSASSCIVVHYSSAGTFDFYIINLNNASAKMRSGTYTFNGTTIAAHGSGKTARDKVVALGDDYLEVRSGGAVSHFDRISGADFSGYVDNIDDVSYF